MLNQNKLLILISFLSLNLLFQYSNLFHYVKINLNAINEIENDLVVAKNRIDNNNNNNQNQNNRNDFVNVQENSFFGMQPKRSDLIQQKTVTKLIRRLLSKHSQWFRIIVDRKFRSEKDFLDKFKVCFFIKVSFFATNYFDP